MEETQETKQVEAPEAEIGRINRERDIDSALTVLLCDAAWEIVKIAQDWEMDDGASDENPVMEVAAAMLRNCRILKRQHYMNTHAGVSAAATGVFDLPRAVRLFYRNWPVSRERRPEAEK